MSYVDLVDDTICALITTPGLSGISVIRVSGPRALELVKKNCSFLPAQPESHRVYFGRFKSNKNEVIDECLVTYFAEGKSFTSDQTLEISVHGGITCADRTLAELLAGGCRAAERGEFSFRAFYSGKIDLVQAEAIHSLIKSRSDHSRAQAIQQLTGRVSQKLTNIEDRLIQALAQIEASIDFSTEDIEPYSLTRIQELLVSLKLDVDELVRGYQRGRIINEGLQIILAGAPNAGKSSLYNALLGQDKAIVSATPGTTRDLLESPLRDFGMPLLLVDTAGLRETQEDIERIGIQKTQERLGTADLIFYLLDVTQFKYWDLSPLRSLKSVIPVVTKIDQVSLDPQLRQQMLGQIENMMTSQPPEQVFFISSKTNHGIQEVRSYLEKKSLVDIHHDESLITQHRHFDHLSKCQIHLQKAIDMLNESASYDLLALELQSALRELFCVLGKEFDEQVLDQVFKQFCIGK
jgi:tRNA modification GTPase